MSSAKGQLCLGLNAMKDGGVFQTCQTLLWTMRLRTWWLGTTDLDWSPEHNLRADGSRCRRTLRDSMLSVNPRVAVLRAMSQSLHRRSYRVAGPNFLWHLDGNHKLIRAKVTQHLSRSRRTVSRRSILEFCLRQLLQHLSQHVIFP